MAGLSLGLGLSLQRRGFLGTGVGYELREDGTRELREDGSLELREEAVADPYVEPSETDDPPEMPPTGSPTPPGDTPTDPDTGEPEPGVDPDFVAADRIEITGQSQTVIRTTADPGTWGNAYVAAELGGHDYWEIHISGSTPQNATLAVGVTNLDLPLNGIPGDEAGTLAYWSSGVVRSNGVDTSGFPRFRKGDKIRIARDRNTGRVWFGVNGTWLDSTPAVGGSGHQGTLVGDDPYYPFTAIYSTGASVTFKFASSKFSYAVPDGFYPIGQTPVDFSLVDTADSSSSTIAVDFGTAHADRHIIVTLACGHTTPSNSNITAVSIGGVAASAVAKYPAGTNIDTDSASIWIAAVSTGTSGNIVVTASAFNRFAVAVYRAVGLSSATAADSGQGDANNIGAIGIDIPAGGFAVGVGARVGVSSSAITVSGVSQDFQGFASGGALDSVHGSMVSAAGETVNVDISATSSLASLAAASFR